MERVQEQNCSHQPPRWDDFHLWKISAAGSLQEMEKIWDRWRKYNFWGVGNPHETGVFDRRRHPNSFQSELEWTPIDLQKMLRPARSDWVIGTAEPIVTGSPHNPIQVQKVQPISHADINSTFH